jgi:glycosyltransferase involved in cell wall biosynthesis
MYKFIIFSPAFNCSKFIEKHIHSVNIQTNTNYIHLLIDDASTDNTYKIISQYRNEQRLVFSTLVNQKWIANSLVFLPRIAQDEDIIVCLDADD